ncbi:MAG: GIY-YIG nuclease family protein [Gammaproteobacteria bacterium]|nr:GIY-YIG nuclease family protein [Gammaproteobacteria bacterium]MDH3578719.1 GIY-YIG nuclease family protein [Gammaproteobacteria bacterium]
MSSSVVFSLYIVRCSDDSLYTGIAADVRKRICEHESSPRGARYLRGKGPLRLEFAEQVGDRGVASTLEYRVKRLTRARKEALISGRESLRDLLDDADFDQASGAG